MQHRQKQELRELQASQKARRKEAGEQDKAERRKFFAENPKGPDRRRYMKDLIERKNTRDQIYSDELATRRRENEVRIKALREDQSLRLKDFQSALERNERPPEHLWSYR